MQKKGQLALKPVIEMLIAALVVASFFGMAEGLGTKEFFVQARIAREGALIVNELYAVPGNEWIALAANVSKYDIELRTRDVGIPSATPFFHAFPSVGDVIPARVRNPDPLIFSRDGDEVSIGKEGLKKFSCGFPKEDFSGQLKMKVTQQTETVAKGQVLICSSEFLCARSASALQAEEDVFIKVVPMAEKGIAAYFYYNSSKLKESKQLACLFLNRMSDVGEVDVWLLPTDDRDLESRKDKIAVLFEIGDIELRVISEQLRDVLTW